MSPEQYQHQPEPEGILNGLRERIEASRRRTEETHRAVEASSTRAENKYETPAILMSQARTKAHRDFEHIEDILERGTQINRRKEEINQFIIVPDETIPNRDKNEITASEFKKLFL